MTVAPYAFPDFFQELSVSVAVIFGSMFLASLILSIRDWRNGYKKPKNMKEETVPAEEPEYTPLKEATEKIYTACRASKNEQHRIFEAVEAGGIKPIVYLAEMIVDGKNLFGKKTHSDHLENTNGLEGRLSVDLDNLTDYAGKILFSELSVPTKRMNEFLEDIKNDQ